MTGISLYVLTSAAVGAGCAAAGVYAVPALPARAEMDRALLRTGVAAAAACAWGLWRGQAPVTLLSFAAATLLLGEVRVRALERAHAAAEQRNEIQP